MKESAQPSFGARLKALREASGFTQEELATISGLSVHAVSALERGHRRRPQVETVRALSTALDLEADARDALTRAARSPATTPLRGCPGDRPLPTAPTPIVGRDVDVRSLRQWLDDPSARLVTLTGPGGAGKTRLALELAGAIAAGGATRVLFVPLASARTPAFVASAIAEALDVRGVSTVDLPAHVRAACDGRPTLIVLDNLEQVLDAAPLIAELLASDPTLTLLATSRSPLRLRGEREYPVGPLPAESAAAGEAPALQLFAARVRDVRPDFSVSDANRAAVTEVCRLLDALPLALELAAPWMKVLTADELVRRLANDCLLPSAAPRDLPERHQTMHATVAWSYQLLGEREREAFQRLGALPGQFSIEAAAAVLAGRDASAESSDWAIAAVSELIDKSLLRRVDSPSTGRPLYRMLETIRAYAALELAGSGERDDVMEGLARHYAEESTRAAAGLAGLDDLDQIDWLDRVRDDLDVYRALLTWHIDQGQVAEAAHLACQLMFFWLIRGHAVEALGWYEQILDLPLISEETEARVEFAAGVMSYSQGDLAGARASLMRALALGDVAGDDWAVMQAENMLGHVESGSGNFDAARARFAAGLEGFRTAELPGETVNALGGLAWVALAKGEFTEAERLLDEAEVVDAGSWFLMLPLYLRAVLAVRRGDADQAIAFSRESLVHIKSIRDRFVVVYALVPFAAAAVLTGEDEWAARILGAREAITELSGARAMDDSVLDLRDQVERQARGRLGPERWRRAYSAGRRTTVDMLLDEIDARVPALRE